MSSRGPRDVHPQGSAPADQPLQHAWAKREPGQLIGRGHPAGDFLEAYQWQLLEDREGFLRVRAHLPQRVLNPRGQLFGGFTPTYVDLVALFTTRAGAGEARSRFSTWLATINMRIDYFEPVPGPHFLIESQLVKRRGRTLFVESRFLDEQGDLLVFALTTLREQARDAALGDV